MSFNIISKWITSHWITLNINLSKDIPVLTDCYLLRTSYQPLQEGSKRHYLLILFTKHKWNLNSFFLLWVETSVFQLMPVQALLYVPPNDWILCKVRNVWKDLLLLCVEILLSDLVVIIFLKFKMPQGWNPLEIYGYYIL